jgi:transcriptional regulator with XRE-family HTH domain
MKKSRIKQEIIDKLKERANIKVRNAIAVRMEVGAPTVEKWLSNNSVMLTTADTLEVISEKLDIPVSELLEILEINEK